VARSAVLSSNEPGSDHRAEEAGSRQGRGGGDLWARFFAVRPILALAILTPGLPEYLSTSSSLLSLAVNPAFFFLQLAVNLGQYTGGALLIREAMVRWGRGWASVFLLAAAYGITEEGLGDSTLFNSAHGADGVLGSYGRFAGVNWVWSAGVLLFHVVYSIGLPILLLALAVPSTRGRSLIGRRGIVVCFLSVAAATLLENRIVFASYGFFLGAPLLVASLVVIAVLVLAARLIPRGTLLPFPGPALATPAAVGALGFAVFPIAFLLEYGGPIVHAPAVLIIAIELVVFATLFALLWRGLGGSGNEYLLVNLAFGFVLWQCVFGFLLTLGLPYTLPLIVVAVWFFVRLRRQYSVPPTPPPGAAGEWGSGGAGPASSEARRC
jgi:hypothetical protein